jgi:acyl-coenzyme A thioesterase PaaI-like protein
MVGEPATSLDEPLWQRTGIEMDDPTRSALVELTPEITNHVSSLQGGVTAALLEAAARTELDPGTEIRSMVMTFLSQGRHGPYRATARRTGPDADVVVSSAVDLGNDDRPLAHAVFTTVTATSDAQPTSELPATVPASRPPQGAPQ